MHADPTDTLECGRCGRRHPLRPELAGKSIACSCGQLIAVPAAAGSPDDLIAPPMDASQVQAPQGIEEMALPQGMLWLAASDKGVDAYLLTEADLKIKNGIAGSMKKFHKLMAEKGDIDAVAKSKWTTTIPLDAVTKLERANLDNFAVIHYEIKGRRKKLKVSLDGTNLHALVFEALRLVLAPDRQPVATPLGFWEISGSPIVGGVVTLAVGLVLIGLSFSSKSPTSGKGWVLWWVATFLGTAGCVAITAAGLVGIAIWLYRRFNSRPMKDVLVIRE